MKSGHVLLVLLCIAAGCKAMPGGGPPGAAPPTSAAAGATTIVAIAPPAAPQPTLWGFLGLDKLFGGIYAKEMRKLAWLGQFFPGLEPTTAPLRPLADPANMDSPNPAVKAAAEAKADQDAAPQKIKALKFLGSVGCDSHPDIEQALLSGLEDSIEEVRYAAVSALYEAAGNPCETCDTGRCCSPPIRRKLHEIGYKMNDYGCYVEPSARVRRIARLALSACGGEVPPPEPVPDEVPPVLETVPEAPPPAPPAPAPAPGIAEAGDSSMTPLDPALELAEIAAPVTRRRLLAAAREASDASITGAAGGGAAQEVIAVVNGENVPASEINREFEQRLAALDAELSPEQQRAIFKDVMQRAIHDRLLLQEARQRGNATVVAQMSYQTPGAEDSLASRWLSSQVVVDEHVRPEEIVSRYEVSTTAYLQGPAVRWERVHVPFVRAADRAQASALIEHLWDRAVGVASQPPQGVDPQIAETQIVEWTAKEDLPSERMRQILFALPIGRVSEILEDASGYSMVRVLQRRGARRRPLAEVSDEIRAAILRERKILAEREYLEGLRRNATIWTAVQVFDDDRTSVSASEQF